MNNQRVQWPESRICPAVHGTLPRRWCEAGSPGSGSLRRIAAASTLAAAVLAGIAAASVLAADDLSLAGKAHLFGVDLAERFLAADGQVRVRRRLPTASGSMCS